MSWRWDRHRSGLSGLQRHAGEVPSSRRRTATCSELKRLFQTLIFYYPAELLHGSYVNALPLKATYSLLYTVLKYGVFKVQIEAMTDQTEERLLNRLCNCTARQWNGRAAKRRRISYNILLTLPVFAVLCKWVVVRSDNSSAHGNEVISCRGSSPTSVMYRTYNTDTLSENLRSKFCTFPGVCPCLREYKSHTP